MPIVGEAAKTVGNSNYKGDTIYPLASRYHDLCQSIKEETQYDILTESTRVFSNPHSREMLKQFFLESSYSPEDPWFSDPMNVDDHISMMESQFDNDIQGIREYTAGAEMNPVVGMTFPIHKNILMNCVFDKGGIQKVVATAPKFTESLEIRYMVGADGTKIDIFKEQLQISKLMRDANPPIVLDLALPVKDISAALASAGYTTYDNIGIDTYVSDVGIALNYPPNTIEDPSNTSGTYIGMNETAVKTVEFFKAKCEFTPYYDDPGRVMSRRVRFDNLAYTDDSISTVKEAKLYGEMKDNNISIISDNGLIKSVRLVVKKDPSHAMLATPSVNWEVITTPVEIPNATPINVALSPEAVKDIGALYNINQVTKMMSMINIVLENYKDDTLKTFLDDSFAALPDTDKVYDTYDMQPRDQYVLDHVEWRRKTFMDEFETATNDLLYVLNDPNVTFTVFGRPEIIRKITPLDYVYSTPSNIGPVELNYNKVIVNTTDKRTYQFISSMKLRRGIRLGFDDTAPVGNERNPDELIIILQPRNTNRIIYRVYDYQMYISNEIRNAQLYTLPAIHAFERFKPFEYQPVQGRIRVLNPRGFDQNAV
jgi:hypothetical protein